MLGVVALVSVVAASCGRAAAETESSAQTPADGALQSASLPIASLADRVYLSEDEHIQVEMAIQRCMADKGFEYEFAPFFDGRIELERRYGVTDPQRALEVFAASDEPDAPTNPALDRLDQNERDAWWDAFFGPEQVMIEIDDGAGMIGRPAGGCLEVGWEVVVGDVDRWFKADHEVQAFLRDSYLASMLDARVQAAMHEWSACMGSRGFNVATFDDLDALRGSARDTEMIFADASCNSESDLAAIWFAVESEIQDSLLPKVETEIDELLTGTTLDR
jgi:hypothetical protein